MSRGTGRARKRFIAVLAVFIMPAAPGFAETDGDLPGWVAERYRADAERYSGDPQVLVRPGLKADRGEGTVTVLATANLPEYPVEYFMVSDRSGRDYESLLLSHAEPSAIHEALEFLGMRPGRPVDYDALRFWPRGERVYLRMKPYNGEDGERGVAVESLVRDLRSGESLPVDGMVFVGSRRIKDRRNPGQTVYAADAEDPYSIASNYNEPWTVLDIPRRLSKGEAYEFFVVADRDAVPDGEPVNVVLRPEERPEQQPRVALLTLRTAPADGGVKYYLRGEREGTLLDGEDWVSLLAAFGRLTEERRDPFVKLEFDRRLALRRVVETCRRLDGITGERGIRIEPPPTGEPYYGAFIAGDRLRDRGERVRQPWELHLTRVDGVTTGMLFQLEQEWEGRELDPKITEKGFAVREPGDAERLLEEHDGMPVVVFYARGSITYGALLEYVRPILATHPTVYVFATDE